MTQWMWTVALLGAFVVVAVGLAPAAHADAKLAIDANVTEYELDGEAVESVTVRLNNTGERAETVVFATWAKQGKRMATWTTSDGQRRHTIKSGETRTLKLSRRQFTATDQPVMLTIRSIYGNRRTHAIFTPEAR